MIDLAEQLAEAALKIGQTWTTDGILAACFRLADCAGALAGAAARRQSADLGGFGLILASAFTQAYERERGAGALEKGHHLDVPPLPMHEQILKAIYGAAYQFSRAELLVLLRLGCAADHDACAAVTVDQLARDCHLSDRGVQRSLQRCVAVAVLRIVEPSRGRMPNRYRFDLARLDALRAKGVER